MNIKRMILIVTTAVFFTLFFLKPVNAADHAPSSATMTEYVETNHLENVSEISPFATRTGWKYKVMHGALYKRLYDYTNKKWIGNWIRA